MRDPGLKPRLPDYTLGAEAGCISGGLGLKQQVMVLFWASVSPSVKRRNGTNQFPTIFSGLNESQF